MAGGLFDDIQNAASAAPAAAGGLFDDIPHAVPAPQAAARASTGQTEIASSTGGSIANFARPISQAARIPSSYGPVDFTKDKDTVRKAIAALPKEHQQHALDAWSDHYVDQQRQSHPYVTAADDVVRAMGRGTPVGSWLDRADAGWAALGHSISNGFLGAPYDESLAYQRSRDRAFDAANPKTATGLKIAGGIASIPATPLRGVAAGTSLLGRTANGMANGAAYGALYGAGTTDDLTDIGNAAGDTLKGATIGGTIGGVAVPVAAGTSNAVKYVADKFRSKPAAIADMSRQAADNLSDAMAQDKIIRANGGPPQPLDRSYPRMAQELGPEGMLADMGPNLEMHARGIARQNGEGATTLLDALRMRGLGAKDRIAADTTSALGPAKNLVQEEAQVMQAASRAAKPYYDAFYNTAIKPSENLISILGKIPQSSQAGQKIWGRAQELAQVEGVDLANAMNTGRGLDLVKRGIDDYVRETLKPGTNAHRLYSNLARDLRTEVDNILTQGIAKPGETSAQRTARLAQSPWAKARQLAGEGLQFREGLEEGGKAFTKGVHPDQMAADMAGMSDVGRRGFAAGARGAVRDIMGNASTQWGENGASAARSKLGNEYARDKLAQVVGDPAKAARLVNRLDAETRFAKTLDAAAGNSATAQNQAAQKLYPSAGADYEAMKHVGEGGVYGMAARAGHKILKALTGGHRDAKNARISSDAAKMLTAQGSDRDAIAQALMKYGRARAVSAQTRDNMSEITKRLLLNQSPRAVDLTRRPTEVTVPMGGL